MITPYPHSENKPIQYPACALNLEELSSRAVDAAKFGPGFVRPLYESYCFSNLSGFFEQTLLGKTKKVSLPKEVSTKVGEQDHIVFVFFDAFGWESFQQFRDASPFLSRFSNEGAVLKTTAQFPSTTAAHIATSLSGLPAYTHEVCGWDYYEPKVGRMIKPLRSAFSEDSSSDTLLEAGFYPSRIFPRGNFFPTLLDGHVDVRLYGPKAFFPSPFGLRYASKSRFCGYDSVEQGIGHVVNQLESNRGEKTYSFLYIDLYDTVCHENGVGSRQANEVAARVLHALEGLLVKTLPAKTLICLSADHGHVADVEGGKLEVNELIPEISQYLKRDQRGEPIRFSGGGKHLFLHPHESAKETLLDLTRRTLSEFAEVMTINELSDAGLLGPRKPIASSFIEKLGTIGILPHKGYSVNWRESPSFVHRRFSGHGGATVQEMETPLLLLPV